MERKKKKKKITRDSCQRHTMICRGDSLISQQGRVEPNSKIVSKSTPKGFLENAKIMLAVKDKCSGAPQPTSNGKLDKNNTERERETSTSRRR